MGAPYEKTPALELAPYMESIIDGFETDKKRVRLMELQPQKSIFWHYDKGETIDNGKTARIHIPVFYERESPGADLARGCRLEGRRDLVW